VLQTANLTKGETSMNVDMRKFLRDYLAKTPVTLHFIDGKTITVVREFGNGYQPIGRLEVILIGKNDKIYYVNLEQVTHLEANRIPL
jgi:hypothetical protein